MNPFKEYKEVVSIINVIELKKSSPHDYFPKQIYDPCHVQDPRCIFCLETQNKGHRVKQKIKLTTLAMLSSTTSKDHKLKSEVNPLSNIICKLLNYNRKKREILITVSKKIKNTLKSS